MTSIYLAGKIYKNDWRHEVAPIRGVWGPPTGEERLTPWPVLRESVLRTFDYVGPYFQADDHGCFHGRNSHGCDESNCGGVYEAPTRADLQSRCFKAIQKADIVFAWLDDPTAYGTLVEIGYAKGLGKRVVVATPDYNYAKGDMWFAHVGSEVMWQPTAYKALVDLAISELKV